MSYLPDEAILLDDISCYRPDLSGLLLTLNLIPPAGVELSGQRVYPPKAADEEERPDDTVGACRSSIILVDRLVVSSNKTKQSSLRSPRNGINTVCSPHELVEQD